MDLIGLTDDELLSRRHQAFLRLQAALGSAPRRADAYEEIGRINRELKQRRPAATTGGKHGNPDRPVGELTDLAD